MLFVNGLGLDDGVANGLKAPAGNPKWKVVDLTARIDKDWLREGECHHDGHADGAHEHGTDPHAWLGVRQAKKMVEQVRDTLKELDPPYAVGYESRASAYLGKLDKLQADCKELWPVEKAERRIVSFHDSLGYFGESYDVRILGSIEVEPGVEPSGAKLNQIVKTCHDRKVRVIAVEPQFPRNTCARSVRDALKGKGIDAVFVEVDPLETADESELTPDLYERKMRANVENLAKAFR